MILQKIGLELLIFNKGIPIPVPYSSKTIIKFQDKICLEIILFVSKSLNNLTPSVFNTWFSFSSDQHIPQVIQRVTSQNFLIKQIYMGTIQSL